MIVEKLLFSCRKNIKSVRVCLALVTKLLLNSLIVFAIGFVSTTTLAQNNKADSKDNESRLQAVQAQISSIEKKLNQYKGARSKEYKKLQQVEVKLAELNSSQRQTEKSINQTNQKLKLLQQQYKQLLPKKAQQQLSVRQQLQAAYRMGKQDKIKILLNQDNPEVIARMLKYNQYIGEVRSAKIQSYVATLDDITEVQEQTKQQKITLNQYQAELKQQHNAVLISQNERQEAVAKLTSNIESASDKLSTYQRQSKQLQQLIESVLEVTIDIEAPLPKVNIQSVKGQLKRPVKGRIINRYNSQRIGGLKWAGVFIGAREGSSVTSVYYGKVVFSGYLRGLGLLVIIDHGNDYLSLYGHNQTLNVRVGDNVRANQVIAQAGNTGGQERSGLYFEFRHKGKTNNPASWVKF